MPALSGWREDAVIYGTGEAEQAEVCWLCGRPLGRRVERHHPLPRSRGGRETVPVHPICHRAIHASFTNARLALVGATAADLAQDPAMARFLRWVANKHADFHAPTPGQAVQRLIYG